MELWFIIALLAFLSHSISMTIDKYLMRWHLSPLRTNTIKMFFDGFVVLIIGGLFLEFSISLTGFLWAMILGLLYAATGVLYFTLLSKKPVEEVIPTLQSGQILLVFLGSILFLQEAVTPINWMGLLLILLGVYSVLSRNGIKLPTFDHAIVHMGILIGVITIWSLLNKHVLQTETPISLAIVMYLWATIFLVIYDFWKHKAIIVPHCKASKIAISAIFGGTGTLLMYYALSLANASKVYPLAGLESVFVFIFATIFLKDKFMWHRLCGVIFVLIGIFMVSYH